MRFSSAPEKTERNQVTVSIEAKQPKDIYKLDQQTVI